LEDAGFKVFLNQKEYVAGLSLPKETRRQVRKSKKLVLIGRSSALRSVWVGKEVEQALADGKIPIIIDINNSIESARSASPLAAQAIDAHWLRLFENLGDPDGEPSNNTVAEIVRAFNSTRQQTKRERVLAAVALVLATTTAIAGWQWYAAHVALDRAISTSNDVVHDLAQYLRKESGIKQSVIGGVLDKAQSLSNSLADLAISTPELKWARAVADSELSKTHLLIGRIDDAVADAKAAEALFAELHRDNPDDVARTKNLIEARLLLGDVFAQEGDWARAKATYDLTLPDATQSSLPIDARTQIYERSATALNALGLFDEAQQALDRCLALWQAATGMDALVEKMGIASCTEKSGDGFLAQGKADLALKRYGEGLAALQSLDASQRQNDEVRFAIATIFHKMGDAARKQENYDAARENYKKDFDLVAALLHEDPERTDRQNDVMLSLERLGDVDIDLKNTAGAFARFKEAIALVDGLRQFDPARKDWLVAAVKLYQKALVAASDLEHNEEALGFAERRLAIVRGALAPGQLDAGVGADLISALNDVAWYGLLAKAPQRALDATKEALTLNAGRTESLLNEAHALMFLGRTKEARDIYLDPSNTAVVSAQGSTPWKKQVLEDFEDLQRHSLSAPLMDAVKAHFQLHDKTE
jgi:tetratricopeptide (TPR) repeat protein